MSKLTKYNTALDLSKLTEGELKELKTLSGYIIDKIDKYPFLIFAFDVYNQCGGSSILLSDQRTSIPFDQFKSIHFPEPGAVVRGNPDSPYYPLFDHMKREYDLTLFNSELEEIILQSKKCEVDGEKRTYEELVVMLRELDEHKVFSEYLPATALRVRKLLERIK